MKDLDQLSKLLGKDKAKEILTLTKNYDSYVLKFKKKINTLLEPHNLEAKVGLAFLPKDKQEK